MASIPGQTAGVSVYTEHLMESLGLTRLQISLTYLIGTVGSSLLLPRFGRLIDRCPTHRLMFWACVGLAAALTLLSYIPELLLSLPESSWTPMVLLTISFLAMRQFGQGQIALLSRSMIARWFVKKRGAVVALNGTFVSFGFGAAPWLLFLGVSAFGWQNNLRLSGVVLLAMALLALFSFRTTPEESGLGVDFSRKPLQNKCGNTEQELEGVSLASARRQRIFWSLNLSLFLQALSITAITFHIEAIGAESGIPSKAAFSLFFPIAVLATLANPLTGWMIGRVSYSRLIVLQSLAVGGGALSVSFLDSNLGYVSVAVCLGFAGGMYNTLNGVAWAGLFGRRFVGEISGYGMAWMVFGSAVGPWLYGWVESVSSSFFLANVGTCIVGLVLAVFAYFCHGERPDPDVAKS